MGVRFRFDISPQETVDKLAANYASAVILREGTPIFDYATHKNLGELAKYLTGDDPHPGVMFCGPCGDGKTTMLHALQYTISSVGYERILYTQEKFATFMNILDARDIVLQCKNFDMVRRFRSYDLLAIDDLGKEPLEVLEYGTVLNPILHLLEYRYEHRLFTAISTNLTPKEIGEKYGERLADRFSEMLKVIAFGDDSYRRKTK